MGKRSAVVELFLGDMGSMQRELRPSTQREDQLTMETKLEQIAVKAVNQLPKSVVRETPSITTTSSISPSKTSITPAPRPRARRPMESANASIEPCSMSSTAWRSARKSTGPSTSCRVISMFGGRSTTKRARIRDDGAMAKRLCKPPLTRCPLRGRNCCRPRNAGHNSSSDTRHGEEQTVRSSSNFYRSPRRGGDERTQDHGTGSPGSHENCRGSDPMEPPEPSPQLQFESGLPCATFSCVT